MYWTKLTRDSVKQFRKSIKYRSCSVLWKVFIRQSLGLSFSSSPSRPKKQNCQILFQHCNKNSGIVLNKKPNYLDIVNSTSNFHFNKIENKLKMCEHSNHIWYGFLVFWALGVKHWPSWDRFHIFQLHFVSVCFDQNWEISRSSGGFFPSAYRARMSLGDIQSSSPVQPRPRCRQTCPPPPPSSSSPPASRPPPLPAPRPRCSTRPAGENEDFSNELSGWGEISQKYTCSF